MLLGWASNSSNHFQNSQKKYYFLNCSWSILCNIFTENVVSNQAQLFDDMIRADTHKWISIHIFLWYHTLCHVKHFSYDPSATQKSTMGPHYFSTLNWFHKTFPEKSNRRLEDLKEKTCQNTKVIRKSPPQNAKSKVIWPYCVLNAECYCWICIPFGCHKNQRQAAIIHGSDFERVWAGRTGR